MQAGELAAFTLVATAFASAILFLILIKLKRMWPSELLADVSQRASTRGYYPFPPTPEVSIGLLGLSAVLRSSRLRRAIQFEQLKIGKGHRLLASTIGLLFVFTVVLIYACVTVMVIAPPSESEISGRGKLFYALESAVCPTCQSGILVAWFFMICLIAFPIWVRWNRNRYFRWDERAGLYIPTDRARRKWGIRR